MQGDGIMFCKTQEPTGLQYLLVFIIFISKRNGYELSLFSEKFVSAQFLLDYREVPKNKKTGGTIFYFIYFYYGS
jgi:hypothetical protein